MDGLVIKSTGSWYEVLTDQGEKIPCRLKGKLRQVGMKTTNPIAVGDRVQLIREDQPATGVITAVVPRKNYFIRKSTNLSKQVQMIAANLDQAILIITLTPPTSLGFIDRFLVTAEAYDIPTILIFNKLDLYKEEELNILENYQSIYQKIGYRCCRISAVKGTYVDQIENLLKNKITLITGHSGAGKSTLINTLVLEAKLKTGPISEWSNKGKHTTTFAEMISLPFGGYLIDTPGIAELGVVEIEKQTLGYLFPELRHYIPHCQFHNCQHLNEPRCAVLAALQQNKIAPSRYQTYLNVYQGKDTRG